MEVLSARVYDFIFSWMVVYFCNISASEARISLDFPNVPALLPLADNLFLQYMVDLHIKTCPFYHVFILHLKSAKTEVLISWFLIPGLDFDIY